MSERPYIKIERINDLVCLSSLCFSEDMFINILDFKLIFGFKPRKGWSYKTIPNSQLTKKETLTRVLKFEKERLQPRLL